MHIHVYTQVYTCARVCIHIHIRVCVYIHTRIHTYYSMPLHVVSHRSFTSILLALETQWRVNNRGKKPYFRRLAGGSTEHRLQSRKAGAIRRLVRNPERDGPRPGPEGEGAEATTLPDMRPLSTQALSGPSCDTQRPPAVLTDDLHPDTPRLHLTLSFNVCSYLKLNSSAFLLLSPPKCWYRLHSSLHSVTYSSLLHLVVWAPSLSPACWPRVSHLCILLLLTDSSTQTTKSAQNLTLNFLFPVRLLPAVPSA